MRRHRPASERGAGFPPRPLRRPHPRRNLVDRLAQHIERADGRGPDWPLEVRLACARQDMEWELDYWDEVNRRATDPVPAGARPR